jgi:hypothetical protein
MLAFARAVSDISTETNSVYLSDSVESFNEILMWSNSSWQPEIFEDLQIRAQNDFINEEQKTNEVVSSYESLKSKAD